MVKEINAQLNQVKGQFAIVVSRFNEFIGSRLLAGAIDALKRHGADDKQITVVWVPGSVEITLAAKKMAKTGKYNAIICLGAVIRGQTSHYDYVCQQLTRGIGQVNYDTEVPTIFGVLTCDTIEQAIDRAGSKHGNAGASAAMAAIEMADLMDKM